MVCYHSSLPFVLAVDDGKNDERRNIYEGMESFRAGSIW